MCGFPTKISCLRARVIATFNLRSIMKSPSLNVLAVRKFSCPTLLIVNE